MSAATRRPQDLQALRRREAFPRSRVRPLLRGHRPPAGRFLANAARPRARTPATPSSPPARRSPAGRRATAYNRGQVLYRVAEVLEGRRDQFVAEVPRARGCRGAQGRDRGRRRHRPLGLVRRAGPTSSRRSSARRTRSPARTSTSRCPSRPAWSPSSPRRSPRCSGWSRSSPRSSSPATPASSSRHERPLPAITLSEVLATSDVPGGVVNVLTGDAAELAPWLASHMDVNAIDLTGVEPTRTWTDLEVAAADNLKRVLRPRPRRPDWDADPGPAPDARLHRDQDRLAPQRRGLGGGTSGLRPHTLTLQTRRAHGDPSPAAHHPGTRGDA
jgi:hypothetical protein